MKGGGGVLRLKSPEVPNRRRFSWKKILQQLDYPDGLQKNNLLLFFSVLGKKEEKNSIEVKTELTETRTVIQTRVSG